MWPPFFSRSSLHMAYYRTPWYFNCKSITHIHTYIQAQPDPISTCHHHNITCLMLRCLPIIKPTSTGWLTSAFPVVRPSTKITCLVMYATKVVSVVLAIHLQNNWTVTLNTAKVQMEDITQTQGRTPQLSLGPIYSKSNMLMEIIASCSR